VECESKKHVFGSEGTITATGCQTLACVLGMISQFVEMVHLNMLSPGQSHVRKTEIISILIMFHSLIGKWSILLPVFSLVF